MEDIGGARCNRPSKNLPRGLRREVRYTVDSDSNLYAVYWNTQIHAHLKGKNCSEVYAGRGSNTEKSSSTESLLNLTLGAITDILWDDDLSNAQINQRVLSNALKVNHSISEGMWVIDHLGFERGLLLLAADRLAPIVASVDRTLMHRDGFACVVSDQPHAKLKNAMTICRLARPALVILECDPLRIRMLDLTTWRVTTIPFSQSPPNFDPEAYYSIHPFLNVIRLPTSLSPRITRSDHFVQLFSRSLSKGYQLDLQSGALSSDKGHIEHFPPHDFVIPVASSSYRPYFMSFLENRISMIQLENGQLTPVQDLPLSTSDSCAMVSGWWNNTYFREPAERFIFPHMPIPRLVPCDLDFLVDSSIFPGDFQIKHDKSGKTWSAHSDILRGLHPTISIRRLRSVIKQSSLPEASILAFIWRLYDKQPNNHDWEQLCIYWLHTSWLWKEIGLPNIDHIFAGTVPQLPVDIACNALIHLWNDELIERKDDDLILRSLAAHVKKYCMEKFIEVMASKPTPHNMRLAIYVSSQVEEFSASIEAPELSLIGLAQMEIEGVSLDFPPRAETLVSSSRPFDFIFSVQPPHDQSFAVVGDMRYMYIRWQWFKRLMSMPNCREVRTRTAVMPHWTTPNMILVILESIHGVPWTPLTSEESFVLLEHRHEIDLEDLNGVVFAPFNRLLRRCRKVCFACVNDSNRIEYLAKYLRHGLDAEVEPLLDSIVQSSASFDLAKALKLLPLEILGQLQEKFRASEHLQDSE